VNSGYCSFPVLMRRAAILAACGLAASAALPAATAAPSRAGDPGPARRLLVRYFDAIRDNDKTTACRMYRLPHCADRTPYVLDAYELACPRTLASACRGRLGQSRLPVCTEADEWDAGRRDGDRRRNMPPRLSHYRLLGRRKLTCRNSDSSPTRAIASGG